MPGLFGIVGARGMREAIKAVDLWRAGAVGPHVRTESLTDDQGVWGCGRSHLGVLQPEPQLTTATVPHVLLHGELHGREAILRRLGLTEGAHTDARLIGHLYSRDDASLGEMDGAYCAAVIDPAKRRTLLINDKLGSYPLYWVVAQRTLVFGSELRWVLKHPAVTRSLDADAVGDYITFGFPLGNKTLASGVQMLGPGSLLVFSWDTGAVSIRRTQDIASAFTPWDGSREEYLDALCDTFAQAVERSVSGPHTFGLSLSGGLDSRAILSAMNGRAGALHTYTLGVRGCADQVIAEALSKIARTQHTFFELDARYLKGFLPKLTEMVSLTDGMYLSHGLTEMLAFDFLSSASFGVLVRGHGGELAKTDLAWPLHTDARVSAMGSASEFAAYMLARANYITPTLDLTELFTDRWAPLVNGAAGRSLSAALDGVPLAPADLCSYLYLSEHHRRFTIPSLELFRHAVEVRMPFVDRAFLDVLFRGRPEWRAGTTIHKRLTAAGNTAMLRVRNSNTGAPANAGPRVEFVLDKMNTILKRLHVSGYRHYHNFQTWMQEQLLSSVESELLSPVSLDRGILRANGLRRLLDDTRAGRADHAYLLQVLLILELWQRENL